MSFNRDNELWLSGFLPQSNHRHRRTSLPGYSLISYTCKVCDSSRVMASQTDVQQGTYHVCYNASKVSQ